jgi:FkbM family methyltransferase
MNQTPGTLDEFRAFLLNSVDRKLLCVDAGARWGADKAIMDLKETAKLLCFDPDEKECERLNAGHSQGDVEYIPLALTSDGRSLKLWITAELACCSTFEPIQNLYKSYPGLNIITPTHHQIVPSTSLDIYLEANNLAYPDIIKLDTQGSELDILRGATKSLDTTCFIDIEVEFNPIYKDQPLFSDVDAFLRAHGFILWRFPRIVHYTQAHISSLRQPIQLVSDPTGKPETIHPGNGQIFWAQAHYIRSQLLPAAEPSVEIDPEKVIIGAAIAGTYGYWDLAVMILSIHPTTILYASALNQVLVNS